MSGIYILLIAIQLTPLCFVNSQVIELEPGIQAVATVGSRVIVRCASLHQSHAAEWLLNGTALSQLHLTDDVAMSFDKNGRIASFTMMNTAYNGTHVQCLINTTEGLIEGPNTTVFFQGLLDAVGSLAVTEYSDNTILLSWTAPFTLDISFNSIDITYCADVVSSTSSATLHSECGITGTNFTYLLPPRSWCEEYNFTVTPVNAVGNGMMNSVQFSKTLPSPEVTDLVGHSAIIYTLLMSSLLCTAELTFTDLFTLESNVHNDTDVTIADTNITFSTQQLAENRHYNLTVTASNIAGSATSSLQGISTHDIIDAVANPEGKGLRISATFTETSVATGAFMCFVYAESGTMSSLDRSYCMVWQKSEIVSPGRVFPLALWPGEYRVYTYDIENNMRLQDGVGYPADLHTFRISGVEPRSTFQKGNCSLSSGDREITVVCSFSQFQVTALNKDSNSRGILYVNTSMDSQTEISLPVPDNGEYLVSVLSIEDGRGVLSDTIFSQSHIVQGSLPDVPVTSHVTSQVTSQVTSSTLSPPPVLANFFIGVSLGAVTVVFWQ